MSHSVGKSKAVKLLSGAPGDDVLGRLCADVLDFGHELLSDS